MSGPLPSRFYEKFAKCEGCWVWTGARTPQGYGSFRMNGRSHGPHRLIYEAEVGPLVPGLVIDHLCRNRACVRPSHLRQVTNRENILAGVGVTARCAAVVSCPRGHPYSETNTRYTPFGARVCITCYRAYHRRYYLEHRDALIAASSARKRAHREASVV